MIENGEISHDRNGDQSYIDYTILKHSGLQKKITFTKTIDHWLALYKLFALNG